MTTDTLYLRDLVTVDADFKPSVQLPFDFDHPAINERLVRSFIPTSQSIEILTEIARSLDPNSTERARAMVGTFGTGKSDLLLVICNYFGRRVDDPLMVPFYERLRAIDPARAGIIRGRREGQPPFLVVLLQADTVSPFPGFVLHGLHHALEKVGLAHLMNKTRYSAAREQIETWQHEGHARYADFCKALEEHEKIDVTSLIAALSGPQSDEALRRFLRTYKEVIGSDFHVYGYSHPHQAYANVAEALVATGAYSGIVLVCDEFTAFLERFQSAIDQQIREFEAETKAVENLAERSGSSGRAQVHFIVASLESFASAAGGIGSRTVAQATERSGGRFKHHSLLIQGSEELIRGTIRRLPAAESMDLLPNAQRDDLLALAEEIAKVQNHWRSREWSRDVIVDGAFPLHPLSTYALPLVNQRVAQSQRTMFLFLKDEHGLRGFIQNQPLHDEYSGWHRLLTLDRLFDYFRESITTKRSDIHDAFEHAEQQVRTATVDRSLATRILKIVALCETVGSDLVLRPTKLFLRRALNLPLSAADELVEALNLLEKLDAIEPPSEFGSDAGVYRLPVRGWVSMKNLRQRITNRAQNLSVDVARLQARYAPDTIQAAEYNRKRFSHRKLSAYYVDITTLRSRERLKRDLDDERNRDGLVWYVVTSSDAERAEAQSIARELTEQQSRLVVAVPLSASHVLGAVRDYQALEGLRRDPELDQVSKPYLEDKGRIGHEYKTRLDYELKQLADPKQWEWFAGGRGQAGLTNAAIIMLASQVMEKVFPDTPATGNEQHFKPGDVNSAVTKAVEQMIKGDIQLVSGSRSSSSPADKVLRVGAVSLGLLQSKQTAGSFEIFGISEPTSSSNLASGKVWRRISEHLATGKPWAHVVRELRQPPFGLYDSITILFLAAFVAHNADSVAIFKAGAGNRALDVDPVLLKSMLERPADYTVRYQPLNEAEKRWLRSIVERGLRQTDFSPPPGTTLRAAVATRVKAWLTRQQIPVFALSVSEAQLVEFLPEADTRAISAIQLVLHSQSSDGELANLLLSELPHRLGAPERHTEWDQATVDALIGSWMTLCDLLARLPVVLKEHVVQQVATLFGAEVYAADRQWSVIHRWRFHRAAVSPERLNGYARELFRLTNLATGSIEQTLLDDFARKIISVGVEYQRWHDLDKRDKVLAELKKARDEIDHAWEAVALGDDIWRDGLVRVVIGRATTGATAERAASELAAWSAGIAWPACVLTLSAGQVQAIYPDVNLEGCNDLMRILKRANYDQHRWSEELSVALPKEFGIQTFSKGEVSAALKRIEGALPLAAALETRLRRYVMDRIMRLFGATIEAVEDLPAAAVLTRWRDRYAIPEPNDLSAEAKSLLFHIGAWAGDAETLLLTTLPRSIGSISRPLHQWERLDVLETYAETLGSWIAEIVGYEPLTPAIYSWLDGALRSLHRPVPASLPRERRRLTALVASEVSAWLREQRLPAFVAELAGDELRAVVPQADALMIDALMLMLRRDADRVAEVLISQELPAALGLDSRSELWMEQEVGAAVERFATVCRLVEMLPGELREELLRDIGRIFVTDAVPVAAKDVLASMREWRAAYVVLPNDPLSPDARLLYESLGSVDDDAESLLLRRLPSRIADVRTPYGNWPRWSMRARYLDSLRSAADEIAECGLVGAGSESAGRLWHEFRIRLGALGDDELRWVVKTFRDEFQQ
jgi:hypothetical protein